MTFNDIFMNLASNIAAKSHCIKNQVGAVLTKNNRVISIGYNGPPAGTYNCNEKWPNTGCPSSTRGGCSLAIHAEQNAIMYALNNNTTIAESTIYITLSPCLPCAKMIFLAGITKVIYLYSYAEYKKIDVDEGIQFLKEFSIETVQYHK